MMTTEMKQFRKWLEANDESMNPEGFEYAQAHYTDMSHDEQIGYGEWMHQFRMLFHG